MPLAELVAASGLGEACQVFELGCGTGRLALRLLQDELPPGAGYLAADLSSTMIRLASRRLAPFRDRTALLLADATAPLPVALGSIDRFLACYVLDILPEEAIRRCLAEAACALVPGGRLCVAGLTVGPTLPSRAVSSLWSLVHRLRPALVGGCRPVEVAPLLDGRTWRVLHRSRIVSGGIPSEVLVAQRNE